MFQDSYLLSLVVLDDIVLSKNVLKICSDDDVTASNQECISEMLLSSPFLRRSSDNTGGTRTILRTGGSTHKPPKKRVHWEPLATTQTDAAT